VQYLLSAEKGRIVSLLECAESRTKILIPDEIELPPDIERVKLRNAVFVMAGP
jgi:hypothetical protein